MVGNLLSMVYAKINCDVATKKGCSNQASIAAILRDSKGGVIG